MKTERINIPLTAISLMSLLFITISASYAYFSSKAQGDITVNTNVTTVDAATFTAYTLDAIELNVTSEDMFSSSTTPAKSDNGTIVASLASPQENITVNCSYDIELIWDTTDQYTSPTTTLAAPYPYEISLLGTQSVSGDTTGHTYTVSSLTETNLTGFTWNGTIGEVGRSAKVISGAQIYSKSLNATTATWNFTLNFYSLPTDQTAITGKNYGAHLAVTNVIC
ncbi:MAG: hypothetical protein E7164_01860 [Firmicutes bacterium]|nr:hypothetical protein [Bacillota bacterium]